MLRKFSLPGSILVLLVVLAYAPRMFPPNVGLTAPEPIGPYLNGVFTPQAPTPQLDSVSYGIENAFPHLTFIDPVKMLELPNGQFLVFSKSGYAWVVDNDTAATTKTQVLDINSQVHISTDGGLLGAVLDPEFGQLNSPNAFHFYVWYRYHPIGQLDGMKAYMRLSRFTINGSYTYVDPASEYVLIQQYDRHNWHNGGDMFFGLDGFLYLAIGDEGGVYDQFGRTQSISDWFFGGVLRIDLDSIGGSISHPIRRQPINGAAPPPGWPNSFSQGYYIPNSNPWQDVNGGILEEFWAIGTRSPHRMTLDPVTGDIWLGDVGQGSMEEISLVVAGANLQWPYMEGTAPTPLTKPNPLIGFDQTPVFAYPRTFGKCVIGGYVVRGGKYPELEGRYMFSDHIEQDVWTLELGMFGQAQNVEFLLNVPTEGVGSKDGVSSFSVGSDGTIYLLDLYGTDLDGAKIHRLVREDHGVPDPPDSLSQLGVFTDMNTLDVAPGIIPYELNSPLWSDRALKKRWIAIPNDGTYDTPGERIGFDPDDKWDFPEGTVTIKHFELPTNENDPSETTRLETRFFIFGENGEGYGLTYRWNTDGTEAFLTQSEEIGDYTITRADSSQYIQTWEYPSRQQCMSCHTSAAGYGLGLKAHQLNREMLYPSTGITADQLETWASLGIFDQPLPPTGDRLRSVGLEDLTANVQERVLSYLDANCAGCHRPNGVNGAFDARYFIPLDQKGIVNEPAIGVNSPIGQMIVAPGDTLNSELWVRDGADSTSSGIMPPIGRTLVHDEYMEVLTEWIMSMDTTVDYSNGTWLDIRVFLEGPYQAGEMSDDLRVQHLIPRDEPYQVLFGHSGSGGGEQVSAATLDDNSSHNAIDWIMVELRDQTDSSVVVETMSAVLLHDGTVIDPQGGPIFIPDTTRSYFLSLRHRNHLGMMLADKIDFDGDTMKIDFTNPAIQLWGTNAMKEVNGVNVMWMGDANGFGEIAYSGSNNDRDAVLLSIGGSVPTNTAIGYLRTDLNMDGIAKYLGSENDRDPILVNIGGSIPTNVLEEQLP